MSASAPPNACSFSVHHLHPKSTHQHNHTLRYIDDTVCIGCICMCMHISKRLKNIRRPVWKQVHRDITPHHVVLPSRSLSEKSAVACVLRHLGHKLENGSLRNVVVLYDLFTSVFMFLADALFWRCWWALGRFPEIFQCCFSWNRHVRMWSTVRCNPTCSENCLSWVAYADDRIGDMHYTRLLPKVYPPQTWLT